MATRCRSGCLITALLLILTSGSATAAIRIGVDWNGDRLIQTQPGSRVPVDAPTQDQPFSFWINHDQDDGVPPELSLRTVSPYGVEQGTGEAIVSCSRSLKDATPVARFDWSCELTIPGGGFQQDWDDRDIVVRFADGQLVDADGR